MKILVVGGAGYVGSALVPELVRFGHCVTVMDLLWFGNQVPTGVPVLCQDAVEVTVEQLRGFDTVIFLAGLSNDPMADFSPQDNFVSNAATPALLAYNAKLAGVRRFVFGGSSSVYGFTEARISSEDDRVGTKSAYGISKYQAEIACRQLQDDDFSVICLRKGTVSGYSPRMRLDLVINTMFVSAFWGGRVHVRNPQICRPILSLQDAVAGYVCAVEAERGLSGLYNLASENCSIGDVGTRVARTVEGLSGRAVEVRVDELDEVRSYRVSTERAVAELGFEPGGTVESIVEELYLHRSCFSDHQDSRYHNITTFSRLQQQNELGRVS